MAEKNRPHLSMVNLTQTITFSDHILRQ